MALRCAKGNSCAKPKPSTVVAAIGSGRSGLLGFFSQKVENFSEKTIFA